MKKIMKNMVSLYVIMAMLVTLIPIMASASTNISVGEYVQLGTYNGQPILWRCVDIDANGPLMLSDEILCYKAFDAPTSLNSKTGSHSRTDTYTINGIKRNPRAELGSNYWADSNIRSWLNSTEAAGDVEWLCGNPPTYDALEGALSGMGSTAYDQEAGFLSNFTQSELDVIKEVTQKSIVGLPEIKRGVYTTGSAQLSSDNYDTAYAEYVTDKMFLLDIKQRDTVRNNSIGGTIGWLRTPSAGTDDHVYVNDLGPGSLGDAAYYAANGVRPAFYLDTTATPVAGSGTKTAPYTYNANAVSTPTIAPTSSPTATPTIAPTSNPTATPTIAPTSNPTATPTIAPTSNPTATPTIAPTSNPTATPTIAPTSNPTATPTIAPTSNPTATPTIAPTSNPTATPTIAPTSNPTPAPINISIGEYVQMGTYNGQPILWRCVDIDANGPLMLSDEILCYKAFDAPTSLNSKTGSHSRTDTYTINGIKRNPRAELGSNYWADSNIRSWLNSAEAAGDVEWLCGNPPTYDALEGALSGMGSTAYDQEAGFLSNFTQSELDVIKEVTQKSIVGSPEVKRGVYTTGSAQLSSDSKIDNYDNAYAEDVTDKMFLLDIKQRDTVRNNGIGGAIGWLRTPSAGTDDHVYVNDLGPGSLGDAAYYAANGVRPAFYLDTAASAKSGSGTLTDPYIVEGQTPPPAQNHSYVINNMSLKTANGTALNNVNSIPSNTGFIVNTSFTKVQQRNKPDYIFAAVYSTSGALLSLDYVQANFADNYTYDIGFYVPPQTEQVGKVKTFIWNDFGDMTPLADSKEM